MLEYVLMKEDNTLSDQIEHLKSKLRKRLVKLINHPNAAKETKEILKSCVEKLIK